MRDSGGGTGGRRGGEPGLLKFDMHVHSTYSGDSVNDPETIVRSYLRTGILPLVCDHNTTAGSAVVYHGIRRLDPGIMAIAAEEVMTVEGEVIGLFLTEEIPPYLPAAETVDLIHDQGGLVLVPHPFCSFRTGSALRRDTLETIAGRVDIIEGFNGRTIRDEENQAARAFAARHRKPVSVGSDAHLPADLGRYWLELEPFFSPTELMKNLTAGTVRYPVLHR